VSKTRFPVPRKGQDLDPGLSQLLNPAEVSTVNHKGAAQFTRFFNRLPSHHELVSLALAGQAARHWYQDAGNYLKQLVGEQDAPRFITLLAATSPRRSVRSNLKAAAHIWHEYKGLENARRRQGSSVTRQDVADLLDRIEVQAKSDPSLGHLRGAWKTIRSLAHAALTSPDPGDTFSKILAGPSSHKVDSFRKNLLGELMAATNDTWVARMLGIAHKSLNKGYRGSNYHAVTALTRQATEALNQIRDPGEQEWTPAETQAAAWSAFRGVNFIHGASHWTDEQKADWSREHGGVALPDHPIDSFHEAFQHLTHEHIGAGANFVGLMKSMPELSEKLTSRAIGRQTNPTPQLPARPRLSGGVLGSLPAHHVENLLSRAETMPLRPTEAFRSRRIQEAKSKAKYRRNPDEPLSSHIEAEARGREIDLADQAANKAKAVYILSRLLHHLGHDVEDTLPEHVDSLLVTNTSKRDKPARKQQALAVAHAIDQASQFEDNPGPVDRKKATQVSEFLRTLNHGRYLRDQAEADTNTNSFTRHPLARIAFFTAAQHYTASPATIDAGIQHAIGAGYLDPYRPQPLQYAMNRRQPVVPPPNSDPQGQLNTAYDPGAKLNRGGPSPVNQAADKILFSHGEREARKQQAALKYAAGPQAIGAQIGAFLANPFPGRPQTEAGLNRTRSRTEVPTDTHQVPVFPFGYAPAPNFPSRGPVGNASDSPPNPDQPRFKATEQPHEPPSQPRPVPVRPDYKFEPMQPAGRFTASGQINSPEVGKDVRSPEAPQPAYTQGRIHVQRQGGSQGNAPPGPQVKPPSNRFAPPPSPPPSTSNPKDEVSGPLRKSKMYSTNHALAEQMKQEAAAQMAAGHEAPDLSYRYARMTGNHTRQTEAAEQERLRYSHEQEVQRIAKKQAAKAKAKVKTIKAKIKRAKAKLKKQASQQAGPVRYSRGCSVRGGKVYCRPVEGGM
jgi:hypothetical protein